MNPSQFNKSYYELLHIPTFEARFEYLKLRGIVGASTFGYDRYINQFLYHSDRWKSVRNNMIIRDNGCDLGIKGYDIVDLILVHHINPLTLEDIETDSPKIYDPNNLICTSLNTHNAIHFGNASLLPKQFVERRPGDTCLWRKR